MSAIKIPKSAMDAMQKLPTHAESLEFNRSLIRQNYHIMRNLMDELEPWVRGYKSEAVCMSVTPSLVEDVRYLTLALDLDELRTAVTELRELECHSLTTG